VSVYREFAPRTDLLHAVHCVWTFESGGDPTPQPIAPDGRPEIIVHIGAPYLERSEGVERVQPRVLFAGQLTQPLTLVAQGPTSVVGVRLRPAAARAFIGADAGVATDKRVDLFSIHGDAVAGLIKVGVDATMQAVQGYVAARMLDATLDVSVNAAAEAILAGRSYAPGRLSQRQWQRRFKREVGISPRTLESIARFRRVFDAIDQPEQPGWVEAALEAGYFDQPQMARDFRRFVGVSARQWARQRAGLATALTASQTYKRRE